MRPTDTGTVTTFAPIAPEALPVAARPGTTAAILARHGATLRGRLRLVRLPSRALGLTKPFFVYEPPGVRPGLPLLYLFRGHHREWVNLREDPTRQKTTAIEDLDEAIHRGHLPPTVVVLPGLTSANNHVHGLGVDMAGPIPPTAKGVGTGRFWTYLTDEVIPFAEDRYRPSQRLAAGFSLGGFTVSLLAFGLPGYLDHAAFYDALFTWPDHDDPRRPEHAPFSDRVWTRNFIFDAAFGQPRDVAALARWNTTDWLLRADDATRAALAQTTYWVQCAGSDGSRGNRDRAHALVGFLRERGLPLGYDETVLDPEAAHTWHWTDRFLHDVLRRTLGSPSPSPNAPETGAGSPEPGA